MVNQLTSTVIFLVLFVQTLRCDAQTVEWSNQQKVKSKTTYTRVLGENASGLYLVRCKNGDFSNELIIEKYKSNLAIENSIELKQPYGSIIEKTVLLNDGLLVIASVRNDSLPKIDVFCWKIDASLKSSPSHLLFQIESAYFRSNTLIYSSVSANKSNFAVMYFTSSPDKIGSVLHLNGYGDSYAETFSKTFKIPYTPTENVISGFECDDEGNAYLLIDYPRASGNKKNSKDERDFYLYSYQKNEDKTFEYKLGNDSSYINDIGFTINNVKKTIAITGTYSLEQNNKVAGTFFYSINAQSAIMQTGVFEPLSKSFAQKISGLMMNETDGGISDLYIRKIIPRSDGGCVMVLEKYYETRQSYTYYANGFPQTASRVTFNYDEIIVISKDANGTTQFQDFIKKNQSTTNDAGYFSSFVLLNLPDKLSFVYSNDVSNDGDIMITNINPLGQIETKILIKSLSYYVLLMPAESKQISANAAVVCTMKDRRFTVMKITN